MLVNLESNDSNEVQKARYHNAVRAKNQIIEPQESLNTQIEVQSGYQDIQGGKSLRLDAGEGNNVNSNQIRSGNKFT